MSDFAVIVGNVKSGAMVLSHECPRILSLVDSIDDARQLKECKAQASAIHEYLKTRRDGTVDDYNAALKIKAKVEHRLGLFLAETVNHAGSRGVGDIVSHTLPKEITRKQSSRAQHFAKLPWEKIEEKIDADTAKNTRANLSRVTKILIRESKVAERDFSEGNIVEDLQSLVDAGKTFSTFYADPPWQYSNQATKASTDNHYDTMTVEEICKLPVANLAADQAHLWLWTTNGFLFECPKLFDAWGFEFKATVIWVKPQIGLGNYVRNSHEILLLAVKGGLVGFASDVCSWINAPRGKHSAKPEEFRLDIVEKVSPGPFLELFGRKKVPGWTVLGNQIEPSLF